VFGTETRGYALLGLWVPVKGEFFAMYRIFGEENME